jgi:uncharacterized phosphosugar-binding protein
MPDIQPLAQLDPNADGIDIYAKTILALQQKVVQSQAQLLKQIAEKMVDCVLGGKRIFVFGTGHSHMLAEEAFCRAGGLAAIVPIFYTALMLHENIPAEALVERMSGLAEPILDEHKPKEGEMIFIFSNSGVNQVPVEMALAAKKRKMTVVSFSSFKFAAQAPKSTVGKLLKDLSDFAIDNGGIPGDAMIKVGPDLVGPSSTIVGCTMINALIVEVARLLNIRKGDAPILISQNVQGGLEKNMQKMQKWDAAPGK